MTQPLAEVVDAEGARLLDALVAARREDAEREPPANAAALASYLDATGGSLAWAAARALGASREDGVRDVAWAAAAANYLRAIPRLKALGRQALPEGTDAAWLAAEGLQRLQRGRRGREPAAAPALLFAWQTEVILRRAQADPARADAGTLEMSEFRRRTGLMRAAATGRV